MQASSSTTPCVAAPPGHLKWVSARYEPDAELAVEMADPKPGENAVDIGTGHGLIAGLLKEKIGSGTCFAVDNNEGYLEIDARCHLLGRGFVIAPDSPVEKQVHLLQADATKRELISQLKTAAPAMPGKFDVVVASHVLPMIPIPEQKKTLAAWKRCLSDQGRLVMSIEPIFTNGGPTRIPAVGSLVFVEQVEDEPVLLPTGVVVPQRRIIASHRVSPDYMWDATRAVAERFADQMGLRLLDVRDIGKGAGFGLEEGAAVLSAEEMQGKSLDDLQKWLGKDPIGGSRDLSGVFGRLMELHTPSVVGMPDSERGACVAGTLFSYYERASRALPGEVRVEVAPVAAMIMLGR